MHTHRGPTHCLQDENQKVQQLEKDRNAQEGEYRDHRERADKGVTPLVHVDNETFFFANDRLSRSTRTQYLSEENLQV